MLRKLRITLAAVFFIGITLLFIGIGHEWWGWMAKLQFFPSCLALNVAVIVGIVLVTLLFGRIYCSVICPMGVFQDCVNWISSRRKGKSRRFKFHNEIKSLRYGILVLFVAALIAGIQLFTAVLAPYSAYGRIVRSIVAPASTGLLVVIVALITLVLVATLAWLYGREWCNSVCPVGTVLSLFSRFSFFHVEIDTEKCKNCHGCEKKCKSSCIDSANKNIDYSRCVVCLDCVNECKFDAIHYKFGMPTLKKAAPAAPKAEVKADASDAGRRAFVASAVTIGAASALHAEDVVIKLDGGLADIIAKKAPERTQRLVPFGSKSEKHFHDHCTACQLCVSACPNKVLRPSTSLDHFMQPEMSYERGYCRPECTKCSEVCPAGAIIEITPEEKTAIHIGRAVIDYDLCIVNRDNVNCGNCSRHCPAEAITMVSKDPSDRHSLKIPTVIEDKCIGCGACENLCPSRPYSAIHVNGLKVHIND